MSGSFDHVQLKAIQEAADEIANKLGATKTSDKLILTRAVFELAAEHELFDKEKLVELAERQLIAKYGWKFTA